MDQKKPLYDLSRRKLLAGLGTVGLASAGAGLGTTAYFTDTESFEGNHLTAGELNLAMAWKGQYNSESDFMAPWEPNSGAVDGEPGMLAWLDDVKPGDHGHAELCFSIVNNPAYLWLCGHLTANEENGQPEPEVPVDATPEQDHGELADAMMAYVSYTDGTYSDSSSDDGSLVYGDGGRGGIAAGTFREVFDELSHGIPLDGSGMAGVSAGSQACFAGSETTEDTSDVCIGIEFEIPTSVGNEIQTDSVEFDLQVYAQQCRHNDGTHNPCADTECVECSVDASTVTTSPEITSLVADPSSTYPGVSAFATIDTPDGTAGTLPASAFSICEDGCERDATVDFTSEDKPVDFAFLFDVSGSMGGEIDGMKANVSDFVTDVEAEGIDAGYALLAFSDDDSSSGTGDAADGSVILSDLTGDSSSFQTTVSGLTLSGHGVGGGLDYPEDAFTAIDEAHTDLSWRDNSQRILVVITDAPSESETTAPVDPTRAEIDAILGGSPGYTLISVSPDPLFSGYTGTDVDLKDVALDNGGLWIDLYGGDFGAILDAITTAVSTSWRITYTTPNPATDGSTRNVLLTVEDPDTGTLHGKTTYVAPV